MGCTHVCHHGQCAKGKDKASAHGTKEKGKLLNIDRSDILLEIGGKMRLFVFQPVISKYLTICSLQMRCQDERQTGRLA